MYKKTKKCCDCGKLIKRESIRCRSCSGKVMWALHIRKPSGGDGHGWGWKGGKVKHGDGYILLYKPNHPRANNWGYVLEHIIIWERANNKPLPEGWCVHHLNGIKDDNRPSNLIGLSSRKHSLVLQAKAKRIQELEALLKNQGQLL